MKLLLMVATKAIGMVKTEQNDEGFSAHILMTQIFTKDVEALELSEEF